MLPDAFAVLLPIVRDLGDHDAADLAGLAGLPAADVSRRWLPWLRAQGLVEPAAYRLAPWAREGMASQTGADILAALECGPLTRDRLVVECSRVREERDAGPASLSGAWRRELDLLVAGGDVIPAAVPWPTRAGAAAVLCDRVGLAEVVTAAQQVAAWRHELWARWEREQRAKAAALVERLGGVRC